MSASLATDELEAPGPARHSSVSWGGSDDSRRRPTSTASRLGYQTRSPCCRRPHAASPRSLSHHQGSETLDGDGGPPAMRPSAVSGVVIAALHGAVGYGAPVAIVFGRRRGIGTQPRTSGRSCSELSPCWGCSTGASYSHKRLLLDRRQWVGQLLRSGCSVPKVTEYVTVTLSSSGPEPRLDCRIHGWTATVSNDEYTPRWLPRATNAWCYICTKCALAQFEPFAGNHVLMGAGQAI